VIDRRKFLLGSLAVSGLGLSGIGPAVAEPASTGAEPGTDGFAPSFQGEVVTAGDPQYPVAKQLELGQFDTVNPKAIAYCESSSDVSLALRAARLQGIPVAVRSGGHSYGGYSTTPGLLIDVSRINAVTIGSGSVTIGPGAMNVDVLNTLAPAGLVVGGGGCPTVAAGGFIQGGGFGFLTRPFGMACDAMTSAQVVLADGSTVTASATENTDLFWALRGGGGGNFGVVTSYQVTPHPLNLVQVTNLSFAWSQAEQVLDAYTRWLVAAPSTIGGGAYVNLPDAGPTATPTVSVSMVSVGTADELATQAGRLIAQTGDPAGRQDAALPYQALMMTVYGCQDATVTECHREGKTAGGTLPRPAFGLERSRLCNTPAGATAWHEVLSAFDADRAPGHFRQLEVHAFGGAANTVSRTATAYVHRDALYCVNYRDTIGDPAAATETEKTRAHTWVDRGFATIDPYSSGESYQNWIDPDLPNWRDAYYAENYPRLLRIKKKCDPTSVFSFKQGIGAAG